VTALDFERGAALERLGAALVALAGFVGTKQSHGEGLILYQRSFVLSDEGHALGVSVLHNPE
jgi:hypothetical protein